MTESDLENALIAFNLAGDDEAVNTLETHTMACMQGLDITTLVNLMCFYGKQRSGSKQFVEALIDGLSAHNPTHIQESQILYQATIALNLISGSEHVEALHAFSVATC